MKNRKIISVSLLLLFLGAMVIVPVIDALPTWPSPDQQLTDTLGWDGFASVTQTKDGKIWVVWASDRTGLPGENYELFRKVYNGTGWSTDDILVENVTAQDTGPSILQASNGTLWLVWASNRIVDPITGLVQYDLFYMTSNDKGATWSSVKRLTSSPFDDYSPIVYEARDGTTWVVWYSKLVSEFMYRDVDTNGVTSPGSSLVFFQVIERHRENVWDDGAFNPGEFIYRDVDDTANVTVGDVRLTAVDSYPAGSTVVVGDADIDSLLVDFVFNVRHTENVASNFLYDPGEFIYRDFDNNGIVSVGDLRLTSVGSYPAGSTVALGDSDAGDVRLTAVGSYAAGSTVSSGDSDAGVSLINFQSDEKHRDTTVNNQYDPGEFMYRDVDASGEVSVGDVRLTSVGAYPAGSTVARRDSDTGFSLIAFQAAEKHMENTFVNGLYDYNNFDIFFKKYSSQSHTWSADTLLTSNYAPDKLPSVTQASDGKFWVVWQTLRSASFDIYYKTSSDGGASWSGDTWLGREGKSGYDDNDPAIYRVASGVLYIIWFSRAPTTNAYSDLCYVTSSDNGATWSSTIDLVTDAYDDVYPSVTQSVPGGGLWVVWSSNRVGQPGEGRLELFYKTSTSLQGDVNGDWIVNVADLARVGRAYKTKPGDSAWDLAADLNNDGRVDALDLTIVAIHYAESL